MSFGRTFVEVLVEKSKPASDVSGLTLQDRIKVLREITKHPDQFYNCLQLTAILQTLDLIDEYCQILCNTEDLREVIRKARQP